jgi:hypothetical protein
MLSPRPRVWAGAVPGFRISGNIRGTKFRKEKNPVKNFHRNFFQIFLKHEDYYSYQHLSPA